MTTSAPTIQQPQAGAIVPVGPYQVEGIAGDGLVTVYDGEAVLGTVESGEAAFIFNATFAAGPHSVSACLTVDGVTSPWSTPVEFTAA